jgi:alpha-1,6-mannosyltransferase
VKIVDICEFYSPSGGGVRSYMHQKLAFAARLGHDLAIIAPGPETRDETVAGGRIAWVKSPLLPVDRNYRMFWAARDIWPVLDRLEPDIVEGSSPWRGGWIAARWPGEAPRVLFMHSDPVASYPHNLLSGVLAPERIDALFGWFWSYLRRLNGCFDATVVTGAWLGQRLAGHGLAHIEVVPLGIDRDLFTPARRDPLLRRALLAECGLGEDAALLIAVGRHHPEKRLGMLIDAVSEAQRQRPIGFYIVGDGLSRNSVEAKAARARHVVVAGQVNDRERLAAITASADALLHGCGSETFGLAVAEALCAGTPVIVPDRGGAADLGLAGASAIYRTGKAGDAAAAILTLLAQDRDALSRAALAGADARISTVEQHFARLFAFYQGLTRSP